MANHPSISSQNQSLGEQDSSNACPIDSFIRIGFWVENDDANPKFKFFLSRLDPTQGMLFVLDDNGEETVFIIDFPMQHYLFEDVCWVVLHFATRTLKPMVAV